MALIAHRFHTIEADGPWTSPPFPPAERHHIIQGVIGGFIMGRPGTMEYKIAQRVAQRLAKGGR